MNMKCMITSLVLAAMTAATVSAAPFTWDGGGTDSFWLTDANWNPDGAPPSDGTATLVFSGNTRAVTTNNYTADTVFAGISLANNKTNNLSSFTLAGNRLVLGSTLTTTASSPGTLSDTLALSLLLNAARTVTVNSAHNLAISGVIGETGGSQSFTKTGSGELTLNGANTYSGKTSLNSGRVYYNSISNVGAVASALGAPSTAENGIIDVNARMTYTGGATTSDRVLNFLGDMQFEHSGSGTATLTGGITGSGRTPTFRGSGTFIFSGLINLGSGGVTRTDSGTVVLSNPANAFTGNLTIKDGTISADTLADAGVACPIGAGTAISIGQDNGTTGRFRYTGADDASCNRAVTVVSQAGNANGGIIECATAGKTLTLSGNVSVFAANLTPTLQLTGVGNGALRGVLNGAMRVTMNGTGIWTLSGANTYTGVTTVTTGTLLVNGSTAAASAVTVAAAGTLGGTGTVNGVVSLTAGAKLAPGSNGVGTLMLANSGASALTLNGNTITSEVSSVAGSCDTVAIAGTLVVNGANTLALSFPGGTAPAGTYTQMTYAARSGSGTLTLDRPYPNATLTVGDTSVILTVTGGGTTAAPLIWQGGLSANAWDTATANWTPILYADSSIVVFDDTGSASPAVNITPVAVAPYSVTVNTSTKAYTIGGEGITGTGGLTKSGTAVLTLTGANSYSGPTAVNAGVLTLNGSLSNSSVTVASGAVLTQGVAGVISGTGVTLTSSGTVALQGTNTYTGATTVNTGSLVLGGLMDGSSITVAATNAALSQSAVGVIAGPTVTLTLRGTSTLAGTNTYGGETTVGISGIPNINVTVNNNSALGSTAGGTTVLGGNGTTLSRLYLGKNVTITNETLTLNGSGDRRASLNYNQSSGTATWDGNIVALSAAYITCDQAGGTLIIGSSEADSVTNSGVCSLSIRGVGNIDMNSRITIGTGNTLLRNDAGTLLLNTASNVWGGTALSEGTLKLGVSGALPATTTLTIGKDGSVNNKATFDLNGFSQQITGLVENHFAGGGGWQRIFSAAPATLIVSSETNHSFGAEGGAITGAVSLVKAGNGTLTLTGTNVTSGSFIVSNGTLVVSATGTFGPNSTNVVVAAGTLTLSNSVAIADTAAVRIADGGAAKLSLTAGVNETVERLYFGDKEKHAGTYSASSGSGAQVIDTEHFAGTGILTVLRGKSGTVMHIQ